MSARTNLHVAPFARNCCARGPNLVLEVMRIKEISLWSAIGIERAINAMRATFTLMSRF